MSKQQKIWVVVAVLIIGIGGVAAGLAWHHRARPHPPTPTEKIAAMVRQVDRVNQGLPDLQVQAKTLVMAAIIQRAVPPAGQWCETLNAGNQLWPVTPTNTVFALNSSLAGRPLHRGMRGDTVVFFEASSPGWNQAGGVDLLADKGDVAVGLLDGRALVVPRSEALKLNWAVN